MITTLLQHGYFLATSLDELIINTVDNDEMIVLAEVKFHELSTIAIYDNLYYDGPDEPTASFTPFFNELLRKREGFITQITRMLFDLVNSDNHFSKSSLQATQRK